MLLRRLQDLLGGIYDVSVGHDVYDFLVTDRRCLPAVSRAAGTDEALLVAQHEDSLAVSLFLDAGVLERLHRHDPLAALHHDNCGDYLTALEGVSHFVYLTWNAHHDKRVSLLELELQAEIDKYVASWWLLRQQRPDLFPGGLRRLLFERTRVDPALAAGREWLYRAASAYAERFCARLERSLRQHRGAPSPSVDALAELRRFYRLTDERKRAHIERQG